MKSRFFTYTIIAIATTIVCRSAYATNSFARGYGLYHIVVGYQVGYSSLPHQFPSHALDVGGIVSMLFNFSYNYQPRVGSKLFVGVGVFEMLKLQYGYALESNNHIFRVRSDWMPYLICEKIPLKYSTIGIFVEKRFGNNPTSGYNVGFTVGLSLLDIANLGQ